MMSLRPRHIVFAVAVILFWSVPCVVDAQSASQEELARAAMGILRDRCLSCHNEAKHKGDLIMTTREGLLRGSGSGAVVVPGDSDSSLLAKSLLADAEVHMPPDDQLPDSEIQVLRDWISASLPWDEAALKLDMPTAPSQLAELPESYHPVFAVALAPDGARLAAARGASILLFNVIAKPAFFITELKAHSDAVHSLAWSTDSLRLASGSYQQIAVHDFATTESLPTGPVVLNSGLSGRVTALAFAPDAQTLYSADAPIPGKSTIRVWNLADRTQTSEWLAHDSAVGAMVMEREGKRLFTGGADGLIKMWSLPEHALVRQFEGHTGHVLGIALRSGGAEVEGVRRLASASVDQQVKIWNIETGEQIISILGHPLGITSVAWCEEPPKLVSACEDGLVRTLNEIKENPTSSLAGATDVVYCVAAARDGSRVFAGCHDGLVYVWNQKGKKLAPLGPETPKERERKNTPAEVAAEDEDAE